MEKLIIKSTAFENGGMIPDKYTGYDEDVSPELIIVNLDSEVKSIAVIMDDLDVPMMKELNHWLLWNVPTTNIIPEKIPHGSVVKSLNGAKQGIGYGIHKYAGPKIPFFLKKPHRYVFMIYALDSMIELSSSAKKKDLIKAMDGHILQSGSIMGICKTR